MSRSAVAPSFRPVPRYRLTTALFSGTTWRRFAFQAAHLPIAVGAVT